MPFGPVERKIRPHPLYGVPGGSGADPWRRFHMNLYTGCHNLHASGGPPRGGPGQWTAPTPMRLTRYTDYALRVLMYLGDRPERTGTISEIAERYRISRNHLLKVVHELAHAGYLATRRGKGGGLQLARPAAQINLGEVVRRMERSLTVVECMGEGPANCLLDPCCALKGAVADARAAFLAALDRYTLADLVNPVVSQRLHPTGRARAVP